MRIDGEWLRFQDDEVRPVVRVWITAPDDSMVETVLLVDTGADRTVLTNEVIEALGAPLISPSVPVAGVGGMAATHHVDTDILFSLSDGRMARFQGPLTAFTNSSSLDISVLGRDILQWFVLIVDGPGRRVCLVNQRHGYQITTA
jgi:hypothetical protein